VSIIVRFRPLSEDERQAVEKAARQDDRWCGQIRDIVLITTHTGRNNYNVVYQSLRSRQTTVNMLTRVLAALQQDEIQLERAGTPRWVDDA
jgi:hypothetical protein